MLELDGLCISGTCLINGCTKSGGFIQAVLPSGVLASLFCSPLYFGIIRYCDCKYWFGDPSILQGRLGTWSASSATPRMADHSCSAILADDLVPGTQTQGNEV